MIGPRWKFTGLQTVSHLVSEFTALEWSLSASGNNPFFGLTWMLTDGGNTKRTICAFILIKDGGFDFMQIRLSDSLEQYNCYVLMVKELRSAV